MLFVSHLRPKSVDQLSSGVSLGFVGTDIEVGLSCGSQHIPINLVVSEFAPKSHQAIELFHGIYRTHQTSKAHNSARVYNPIRDGPEIDVKEGLDQESADLVVDVRKIIANHGE